MTFVEDVLARTSGPSCGAARERFAAFLEGGLAPHDRTLVAGHLARCPRCRSALARERFSWSRLARRLVLRPRFAMEAAYVGAVLLCAVGALTDLPVRAVPGMIETMISDLRDKP